MIKSEIINERKQAEAGDAAAIGVCLTALATFAGLAWAISLLV